MARFVLVHGARHGGWYWKKVVSLLHAAGHDVFAPTLTGLGERVHLAHPGIDLDTHITDIVNVLVYKDVTDMVLVGHSYGGMVITGVADREPERVRHLVYLDAFVPADGESLIGLLPAERAARFEEDVRAHGEGWYIPFGSLERFGVTDAADLAWATPKLVPQPVETFRQPLRLQHGIPSSIPSTYILCNQFPGFVDIARRVRHQPGWHCYELPRSHNAMSTMPRELTDLLLKTVQELAPRGYGRCGGRVAER